MFMFVLSFPHLFLEMLLQTRDWCPCFRCIQCCGHHSGAIKAQHHSRDISHTQSLTYRDLALHGPRFSSCTNAWNGRSLRWISYMIWCMMWYCHITSWWPKKKLTSKHIQRKTETNHKCQTQKQKKNDNQEPTDLPPPKKNTKDLKSKKKKGRQVATLEVHQCKTVPCHHCHRPGFDLTNCWSSPRRQSPTPRRGSMERLTNGAGKPGRTWAKGAEQHATFFEETRCAVFFFVWFFFDAVGCLGRTLFFFGFSKWPKRWLFLENGERCTSLRSGPFTVRTLLNAPHFCGTDFGSVSTYLV